MTTHTDNRGYFRVLLQQGALYGWAQLNESWSSAHVARGLHAQRTRHSYAKKRVKVLHGWIYDLMVDPETGQGQIVKLSEEDDWLDIPPCYHGFITLSGARLLYLVDTPYRAEDEASINLRSTAVQWQGAHAPEVQHWLGRYLNLSDRDRDAPQGAFGVHPVTP
jgi:dTDP-4-dehydrorhamnose 3,5-epimerase-like enzyme